MLDPATGVISGIPTQTVAGGTYAVLGSNSFGTTFCEEACLRARPPLYSAFGDGERKRGKIRAVPHSLGYIFTARKDTKVKNGTEPTLIPTIEGKLQTAVQRLVAALNPKKIILFGSYAYGQPGPDSDVDLLVVMETDQRPIQRIIAVSELLSPRPFPVDIVVRTPAELVRDLQRVDPFMHEVVEKGRVLYEHP